MDKWYWFKGNFFYDIVIRKSYYLFDIRLKYQKFQHSAYRKMKSTVSIILCVSVSAIIWLSLVLELLTISRRSFLFKNPIVEMTFHQLHRILVLSYTLWKTRFILKKLSCRFELQKFPDVNANVKLYLQPSSVTSNCPTILLTL